MDPVWTMIGALAGAGAVALALAAHVIRYAYAQGRTDQRLKAVERAQALAGEAHSALSALTATVEALNSSVERLDRAVAHITRRVFDGRDT